MGEAKPRWFLNRAFKHGHRVEACAFFSSAKRWMIIPTRFFSELSSVFICSHRKWEKHFPMLGQYQFSSLHCHVRCLCTVWYTVPLIIIWCLDPFISLWREALVSFNFSERSGSNSKDIQINILYIFYFSPKTRTWLLAFTLCCILKPYYKTGFHFK